MLDTTIGQCPTRDIGPISVFEHWTSLRLRSFVIKYQLTFSRGVFREGSMPPIVDWVDLLTEKRLCWDCSLYQKCSVDLKYAKNALAAGAPHRTPLGELTTLPETPYGGHPLPNSHPSRRLDSHALGSQLLWLPQCKFLATPLTFSTTISLITARSTPLIETLHWLFQNFRIQWVMQKCTTKRKCKIVETQNVLIH